MHPSNTDKPLPTFQPILQVVVALRYLSRTLLGFFMKKMTYFPFPLISEMAELFVSKKNKCSLRQMLSVENFNANN